MILITRERNLRIVTKNILKQLEYLNSNKFLLKSILRVVLKRSH